MFLPLFVLLLPSSFPPGELLLALMWCEGGREGGREGGCGAARSRREEEDVWLNRSQDPEGGREGGMEGEGGRESEIYMFV